MKPNLNAEPSPNGGEANRRQFLQTAMLMGAGLTVGAGAEGTQHPDDVPMPIWPPLTLTNTGPGQIPQKPFGKTDVHLSVLGMGGHHLGRRAIGGRGGADGADGGRCRHHLLRQLLGVPQRQERGLDGARPAGPPRQSVSDDQGLHPRPQRPVRTADAGGVAAPAADRSSRPLADPRHLLRQRSCPGLREGRHPGGDEQGQEAGQSAPSRVYRP